MIIPNLDAQMVAAMSRSCIGFSFRFKNLRCGVPLCEKLRVVLFIASPRPDEKSGLWAFHYNHSRSTPSFEVSSKLIAYDAFTKLCDTKNKDINFQGQIEFRL